MRIDFIPRLCPVCRGADNQFLFTDINRREGLPVSATLVECQDCGMRYLNPGPDAASLAQLYRDGSVDPVALDPAIVQPVSRTPVPVSRLRAAIRSLNGILRAHPHDWPDEDGQGRSILDFGCPRV